MTSVDDFCPNQGSVSNWSCYVNIAQLTRIQMLEQKREQYQNLQVSQECIRAILTISTV